MKLHELLDEDILDDDCEIRLMTENNRDADFVNVYVMSAMISGSSIMDSQVLTVRTDESYRIIIDVNWEV